MTYTVRKRAARHAKLDILRRVSGFFEPAQMAAVMGPSGSGKTTLLDLLVGRKNQGTLSDFVSACVFQNLTVTIYRFGDVKALTHWVAARLEAQRSSLSHHSPDEDTKHEQTTLQWCSRASPARRRSHKSGPYASATVDRSVQGFEGSDVCGIVLITAGSGICIHSLIPPWSSGQPLSKWTTRVCEDRPLSR